MKTGESKQDEAVVVDTVPLDSRTSLYLAGGDWFAGICLVGCGFLFLQAVSQRCLSMSGLAFFRVSCRISLSMKLIDSHWWPHC